MTATAAPTDATLDPARPLTREDAALLAFAGQVWHRHPYGQPLPASALAGAHDMFGLSEPRFCQAVLALMDRPAAYIAEPVLVKRLRAGRDRLRAARRDPQSRPLRVVA